MAEISHGLMHSFCRMVLKKLLVSVRKSHKEDDFITI